MSLSWAQETGRWRFETLAGLKISSLTCLWLARWLIFWTTDQKVLGLSPDATGLDPWEGPLPPNAQIQSVSSWESDPVKYLPQRWRIYVSRVRCIRRRIHPLYPFFFTAMFLKHGLKRAEIKDKSFCHLYYEIITLTSIWPFIDFRSALRNPFAIYSSESALNCGPSKSMETLNSFCILSHSSIFGIIPNVWSAVELLASLLNKTPLVN